jgi:chemotaxis protein MotB
LPALLEADRRFHRAIENSPAPTLFHAEDGEILAISDSWLEATGYTRGELRTIDDWVARAYGSDADLARARIARTYDFQTRKELGDFVAVRREPGMLVIDVRDAVLFASGEATLRDDGAGLIGRLAAVLAKDTGAVEVIGHTDRRPIATARFPSNWELSSARASAVVRGLIDAGLIPARLSAVGRADTEPLAVERTDAGRARNRRVEIRLRIPQ